MVPMGAAQLRFEVTEATKGKFSLRTYFQDMFRPEFGGGFKPYSSGRGPSVVAENLRGEKLVVEVTKTVEEAEDRAAVMEGDLSRLSADDWCSKYNVPASFVLRVTPPVACDQGCPRSAVASIGQRNGIGERL